MPAQPTSKLRRAIDGRDWSATEMDLGVQPHLDRSSVLHRRTEPPLLEHSNGAIVELRVHRPQNADDSRRAVFEQDDVQQDRSHLRSASARGTPNGNRAY